MERRIRNSEFFSSGKYLNGLATDFLTKTIITHTITLELSFCFYLNENFSQQNLIQPEVENKCINFYLS